MTCARKASPRPGEPPVLEEAVHVDDREQRARNPALRRAARAALATGHAPLPVTVPLLDRRFEPQLDQPQHMPVDDASGHRFRAVSANAESGGEIPILRVGSYIMMGAGRPASSE